MSDTILPASLRTPRSPIQFYFDFSSPYSYIASEWIEAVAARHGRTVQWHAVLLGVLFQSAELKPAVDYPLKRDYVLRDFERSAHFAGLPYRQPIVFPIATHQAARVFWYLNEQDPAKAVAWVHAAFRAYFTRGALLKDPEVLKALAREIGADEHAVEAAWQDEHWKLKLKQVNETAVAAGVFGAPFFIVDGEPFWGNDRQAQIERWLNSGPFKRI